VSADHHVGRLEVAVETLAVRERDRVVHLHEDSDFVVSAKGVHRHDAGVLERAGDHGLLEEPHDEGRIGDLFLDDLDRDVALKRMLAGGEDAPQAAFAEHAGDVEVAAPDHRGAGRCARRPRGHGGAERDVREGVEVDRSHGRAPTGLRERARRDRLGEVELRRVLDIERAPGLLWGGRHARR
jgi:hypothetical protein